MILIFNQTKKPDHFNSSGGLKQPFLTCSDLANQTVWFKRVDVVKNDIYERGPSHVRFKIVIEKTF